MSTITAAPAEDGPAILSTTATDGTFTPEELTSVEEIWYTFRDEGQASGTIFLVSRDDHG